MYSIYWWDWIFVSIALFVIVALPRKSTWSDSMITQMNYHGEQTAVYRYIRSPWSYFSVLLHSTWTSITIVCWRIGTMKYDDLQVFENSDLLWLWLKVVQVLADSSFTIRKRRITKSVTLVSGCFRSVYFHSKNDRNTVPCITEQYGRIRPFSRSFTRVCVFRNTPPGSTRMKNGLFHL